MVVDLPYAGLRRTGRKLYAPGPKAREFVPYPVSGTAPCRVLRLARASGTATIHPSNPGPLAGCGGGDEHRRNVVNARPWATADSIVSLGTRAEALEFESLWVSDQVVISGKFSF